MSYATPFYYAAKAMHVEPHESKLHPNAPKQQRRRRIRIVLFPAQRPQATVASAAATGDC